MVAVERADLRRELIDVREQEGRVISHDARELERLEPGAAAFAIEVHRGTVEVLGGEVGMHAVLEHGALPHEEAPATQRLAPGPRLRIRHPQRRQHPGAGEVRELERVDGIRLRARMGDQLHLVRIDDERRVAGGRELAFEPPAVETGLQDDRTGRRQRAEPRGEGRPVGGQAAGRGEERALGIERAGGDVALM